MSEKRFTLVKKGNGWVVDDNSRKKFYLTPNDVVRLLNNLHQENQQLKHYKLYEDNKRLQTIIADLKEENEQLKKQLELRTESDKYHQRMLMKWLCKDDGDVND